MKRFLAVLLMFSLFISAMAQVPQGTAMRATNGIGFGVTTIANRLIATNITGTNHFAGTLNARSNISSQAIFYGDGSGLTNIGGASFSNLPRQDLAASLNTFGDSIVSGEAGPPGWVYTMTTNLDTRTEIINFGGSGYLMAQIADVFLDSGQTNVPYLLEGGYNDWTGNVAVDGSNILYFISVVVSNTPSPKRFLYLQIPNDHSSSNGTARYSWTTNINGQISAAYPDNYYAWWDWFKLQGDGSAQDNADLAAGVPPSSLMNADGVHPNSAGNTRLGTNMAGIWTDYLRSYQEPLLTGDIPLMLKMLTNNTMSFRNLTIGGDRPFVASAAYPDGSIRMDATNGMIVWEGTNMHGGLEWRQPGDGAHFTVLNINPETGDLLVRANDPVTGTTNFTIYNDGSGFLTTGIGYIPNIQLGLSTAATVHSIDSPAFEDMIAAMQLRTYSYDGVTMSPRFILTTALSGTGTPGIGQAIVTNANLHIASGFTTYGNMSGVSNAVDLISGSDCLIITSNANGRTYTFSLVGSGADVLTNNRTIGTTFLGNLTDTQNGVSTVISSNAIIGGTIKVTSTIQSTNTATANTALTLNGATTGANGITAGYDTNGVNKWKFESDGDGTMAGSLAVAGTINGSGNIIAVGLVAAPLFRGNNNVSVTLGSATTPTITVLATNVPFSGVAIITNGVIVSSNSWLNVPTLAEGDNWYSSSNGIPHVSYRYGGVTTIVRLVP